MTHFLKLTQWSGHRIPPEHGPKLQGHGRTIYINFLLVLDMFQFEGSIVNTKRDLQVPAKDRAWETYTELTLVGYDNDGAATRYVQETPEEILAMINEVLR